MVETCGESVGGGTINLLLLHLLNKMLIDWIYLSLETIFLSRQRSASLMAQCYFIFVCWLVTRAAVDGSMISGGGISFWRIRFVVGGRSDYNLTGMLGDVAGRRFLVIDSILFVQVLLFPCLARSTGYSAEFFR